MTPFMHIVRTKRLFLLSLAWLACVRAASIGPNHVRGAEPAAHPAPSTSGNRRRDSKVRLAVAEATLVCGRGRIAVRERSSWNRSAL